MSEDITELLADWPYDETQDLVARRVEGPGGEVFLQVRLELGILEMHPSGRPDGYHPGGYPSLLHYHRRRVADEEGEERDGREGFRLDHDECLDLHREDMQYYHRRITWLKLGDFDRAAEDAEHNLGIMDLLRERAEDPEDWQKSEQPRAAVLSHWARARALAAAARDEINAALAAVDEGMDRIRALQHTNQQRSDRLTASGELQALRDLRRSIRERRPSTGFRPESRLERVQRQLERAVADEDFEEAARLRDVLARLRQG
ncbi:MAG: UvrB/UvrC motif-containing protein [Armatimonadetes bacterium]|nr:UvrB/UvrC motif-containing protein [Armatimonadota bacterium]